MKLDRTDWAIITVSVVGGVVASVLVSTFMILAYYH